MSEYPTYFDTQVVGAGPGGLGVAIGAEHEGVLPDLLGEGLLFIDSGKHFGLGKLPEYAIRSNSAWSDLYEAIDPEGEYKSVIEWARSEKNQSSLVPLESVGGLLHQLGELTQMQLELTENSGFMPVTHIESTVIGHDGSFTTYDTWGEPVARSRTIVFSTGSGEELHPINTPYKDKTILSHDVLTGNEDVMDQLRQGAACGKIIVEGGSHSSYSAADKLRSELPGLEEGQIVVVQKRPSALFYPSIDAAQVGGYTFDPVGDVCPDTQRVHRYGGIRGDAKDLYLAVSDGSERRVAQQIVPNLKAAQPLLEDAAVIVQALGYQVNEIPIYTRDGQRIGPVRIKGRVEVTDNSQIRSGIGSRRIIPGAYGLGLGYGVLPNARIGGEPNSGGRPVDSVNMFHGPVGRNIAQQLVSSRRG